MIEIFRNPNYNFIGNRRWAYLLSGGVRCREASPRHFLWLGPA